MPSTRAVRLEAAHPGVNLGREHEAVSAAFGRCASVSITPADSRITPPRRFRSRRAGAPSERRGIAKIRIHRTDGAIITAAMRYAREQGETAWWVAVIQGAAALVLGVLLLVARTASIEVVVRLLGWYWLVTGVLGFVRIFMDHGLWGVKLVSAILGVALGTWVIESPLWAPIAAPSSYVWAFGLLGIGIGAAQIVEATRDSAPALYALGVLSVVLGATLVYVPVGAIGLPLVLGVASLAGGSAAVAIAFRLRRPSPRSRAPRAVRLP